MGIRKKQFTSAQSLSHVQLSPAQWTAAFQASLSITNIQNLLKFLSIKSVMPSNHLILSRPLLSPSIFPSVRVFSNELVLHIRWPKYWSFSFSPSNEYSGLISSRMDWLDLLAEKDWRWEEKAVTEDEMVGWYHWLNRLEFEQMFRDIRGQRSLECYSPWGVTASG